MLARLEVRVASVHSKLKMEPEQMTKRMVAAVRKLAADERREEIARMLSGASVTEEARAQASRLLDAA